MWHDGVPEGFVFALKGSRFVTNRRALAAGLGLDGLALPIAGPAAVIPRDVFLPVISGSKERNPAAAVALISRR